MKLFWGFLFLFHFFFNILAAYAKYIAPGTSSVELCTKFYCKFSENLAQLLDPVQDQKKDFC